MSNKFSQQYYPNVTVTIPTYNEASYIQKVVQGFLQTIYQNLVEILVADDGSNDETQNIVKQLSNMLIM